MPETDRTPIPIFSSARQHADLDQELQAAAARVIRSNWYILGAELAAFEQEFAAACNVKYAIGVANGTEALQIALMACEVGAGDEVITAPNSSPYTALAIQMTGARPVFADVDPHTLLLDPAAVTSAVTGKTRAIMPVHLFGSAADMPALMDVAHHHGLSVVEDACQAHGARSAGRQVGTHGRAGAFSFYPTKNLGALGDAGAIITSEPELYRIMCQLRNGGRENRDHHALPGVNSRMDELQAAILRVKLPHLPAWNERRRTLAKRYRERLAPTSLRLQAEAEGSYDVSHLFIVRSTRRDALRAHLEKNKIGTGVHYPIPIHLHAGFRYLGYREGDFPVAERAMNEVLSLPLYPELREDEIDRVCDVILEFEARHS